MTPMIKRRKREAGLSYVEVLIAISVIALALVPALDALETNLSSTKVYGEELVHHHQVRAKLEEVLAEPFANLEAAAAAAAGPTVPTSFSDAAGSADRRRVYLSPYDGDNADNDDQPFTGTDEGLLWVRVDSETSTRSIEALTRR